LWFPGGLVRRFLVLASVVLAACSSSVEPGATPQSTAAATTTATTTASGQGGATATTTPIDPGTTSSSSSSATGSGGAGTAGSGGAAAGGAGGAGGAAGCVGDPGTFYAQTDLSYDIDVLDPVPMCIYRGKVVLVVNTAALCGYTPQYGPLEQLHEAYGPQGFEVVGFLSNDFGNQAGDGTQIDGCTQKYGVSFTQYGIDHVTAPTPRAVYAWLGAQPTQAPANTAYPTWNFHKYLVSRDGQLVAHWPSEVDPQSPEIAAAVEAELAKPAP
jgi:glutathione peroxidase